MTLKRCSLCVGSGKIMGGGFMMKACPECDGIGKIEIEEDDIGYLEKKQTECYQLAKDKLMDAHPNLEEDEAEKLLDDALKQTKTKKIRSKREA